MKMESPKKALSKKLICNALLLLMKEKPFKQISITELTQRADVSRQTFYRNFDTLEEVLAHIVHLETTKFTEYFLTQPRSNLETIVYTYFGYWNKRKAFLKILKNNHLLPLLLECFIPEVEAQIAMIATENNKATMEYAYYFVCGGMWNMLAKWLEDGAEYNPSDMKEIGYAIMKQLI